MAANCTHFLCATTDLSSTIETQTSHAQQCLLPRQHPLPLTGQPEEPPTVPQVQVPMNKAQGPNKTVPEDTPTPQVATQFHQVHQDPQLVASTVMSTTFSLGPGQSTTVLDFSDAAAVKLYNKAILPLELKFDWEVDTLAVFLASVKDHCNHFNWSNLITIPIADSTTRNLLTHYGQVTLSNCTEHGSSSVSTQTGDAQSNDMLYYSWLTLWNPRSEPCFFYMMKGTPPSMLWLSLLFSSRSSY